MKRSVSISATRLVISENSTDLSSGRRPDQGTILALKITKLDGRELGGREHRQDARALDPLVETKIIYIYATKKDDDLFEPDLAPRLLASPPRARTTPPAVPTLPAAPARASPLPGAAAKFPSATHAAHLEIDVRTC